MNASELKLEIFRKIDGLEKSKVEELYGMLLNLINGKKDDQDWASLSKAQKEGIIASVEQIESGSGISHKSVISKYKKKYSND